MQIQKIETKSLEPNKFKNIEKLKEILREAEPLHRRMVAITDEYAEAVEQIKALKVRLEAKTDD